MNKILEIMDLNKQYKQKQILNGVSLQVNEEEIVGLVAPNGQGKSTFFKCVTGLIPRNSGEILLNGESPAKSETLNAYISSMIEGPSLFDNMTGLQNVVFFGGLDGLLKEQAEISLDKWIDQDDWGKKVKKYSLGMKQRLGLFLTFRRDTPLYILDEPFNGLDPDGIFQVREEILKKKKDGKGVLIAAHQLSELQGICDRVVFLKSGKIIEPDFSKNCNLETIYQEIFKHE